MIAEPVAFGPFLLRPDNGTLFRDSELIAIGQRGALLLGALLKSPGEVVTKAELMDAAWPGTAVEESNLSVQIASLRKALGLAPDGHEWIMTVPRVGYRFLDASRPTQPTPKQTASRVVIPSLAVLPFENLSGDPGQDYFADGVVEDIITALSRFKSFAVIARNSSFVYKGSRAVDARTVAEELGVRYVLEGSVRRAGNRLRISAQLVEAATGANLWAEKFEGALEDVFDFQDRITEGVATLVEPQIKLAEVEHSRRERPESTTAYDLYLRSLSKHDDSDAETNAAAYALLVEALNLEPDNAIVLANAARRLHHRNLMGWSPLGPDDMEKCGEFARRALQHAAGDATVMAYCADVLVHFIKDYDWGMTVVQSAVEANPNNLDVVIHAGILTLHCGDIDDAVAFLHRAIQLSPRDPSAHLSLTGIAHVHMIHGNYREALVWAVRALTLSPNNQPTYWMLIAGNAQLGRMAEAKRFLKEFRSIAPRATIASIWAGQPQKDPSRCASILEGLRLAGLDED